MRLKEAEFELRLPAILGREALHEGHEADGVVRGPHDVLHGMLVGGGLHLDGVAAEDSAPDVLTGDHDRGNHVAVGAEEDARDERGDVRGEHLLILLGLPERVVGAVVRDLMREDAGDLVVRAGLLEEPLRHVDDAAGEAECVHVLRVEQPHIVDHVGARAGRGDLANHRHEPRVRLLVLVQLVLLLDLGGGLGADLLLELLAERRLVGRVRTGARPRNEGGEQRDQDDLACEFHQIHRRASHTECSVPSRLLAATGTGYFGWSVTSSQRLSPAEMVCPVNFFALCPGADATTL